MSSTISSSKASTGLSAARAAPSASAAGWLTPGVIGALAFLGIVFVGLFYRFFLKQGEHSWDKIDDWGHAFVIPVISGIMIWRQRQQLAAARIRPFWPGLAALVMGIWCYFFFVVGFPNHMLQGASMVLALAGVCLLVFGLEVFRVCFLPIAFLLTGVTISDQIMTVVTFPLQMLATQGAWLLLKVISLPGSWFIVEQEGNTLTIAYQNKVIPLNVAEACSGMRMVIAFIALAAAVAIFSTKLWWQRAAVLMLAVPVALFMNIIRVAVLALASMISPNLAAGNAHMLIGTLLLIPGLFLFLGAIWCLERIVVTPEAASATHPGQAKLQGGNRR